MKQYEVVAAVIEHDGKILCMQRNKGKFDYVSYKFEFPGGKVEAGEERHTALERELREEMDMDISIPEDAYLMTVEHTYPDFAICVQAGTAQVRYEGACGSQMAGSGRFKQLRLGSSGYADCGAPAARGD